MDPSLPVSRMSLSTINLLLQQAVELHRAGRVDEAVRAYKKVLRQDARAVGALNLLGLAEFQLGHLAKAADALTRAARLSPDLPNIDYNLGRVLQAQGRFQDALGHYEKAVAKAPHDGEALSNLGTVLAALGRREEAITQYRRATTANPRHADAWHNLGNALKALDRFEEALDAYQRELALGSTKVATASSLAYILTRLDRPDEAIEYSKRAISAEPTVADHFTVLGNALSCLGRDEEALTTYDRGIAANPASPDAAWNKGLLLLSRGRFAEGWPLYAQRWNVRNEDLKQRDYPQPRWTGKPVNGTLLVWAEQGLGDQILMSSMIGDLQTCADHLVLEVEPRLVPLLARSFPNVTVVPQQQALFQGTIAAYAALGDVAQHLRPDAESIQKSAGGYLKVDSARAADLRARLRKDGRHVIGLSWASVNRDIGRSKSARLIELAPILQCPNCRFVDVQYGDTLADREQVEKETGVRVEHLADVDNTNDIDGVTALISACDAVVTISNTNAHLAAAQGKPTFLLLSDASGLHWYWMKRGDATPFYASARLFRKAHAQSWPELAATAVVPALIAYLNTLPD